ncbi:MAG: beta-ketoacyl-[acyl-carrier-protein] synthase II [Bacteroidetes bacterium]|nr:MAG: beta-ketoacyl-[acyl-carrier-protein] synthase II [Bacteroidota bacterium]
MDLKRVVITGMGALTPIGNNLKEYWEALVAGKSGCETIAGFDASKFKTTMACELKGYKVADHFDRKEARKLDLYAQYALVVADEAMRDAGLDKGGFDPRRSGVVWGSGIGGIRTFWEEANGFFSGDGTPRFSPFFIPKMISDIAAGQISIRFGLKGPNYGTVSACASSTHAIIDATNLIRLGKADMFVTGGSEAAINEAGLGGFSSMQAISTRNDEPAKASRPFDAERDGFVMGEGAGALILEEYEHAKARGAKIYAEVVGSGMTADAHHLTAPDPEGEGAAMVMALAVEEAGIAPTDMDYINVHGTSTPLGDVAELKAIEKVFGDHATKLNISATKSMTGHLLGAAGAVESIATVMAIVHGIVPPTINLEKLDGNINPELKLTPNKAEKREIRYALSNTFGFGGHNSSVLFKKVD